MMDNLLLQVQSNNGTGGFEGPLDLLLHLIKESKMDIMNIEIESITKQYLDIINSCVDNSVDANSEYLVMAAELIHLKSRLLIVILKSPVKITGLFSFFIFSRISYFITSAILFVS